MTLKRFMEVFTRALSKSLGIVTLIAVVVVATGCGGSKSPSSSKEQSGSTDRGKLVLGGDGDPTNQLQRAIVSQGLSKLGYKVDNSILQPAVMYQAAANGDVDFITSNWKPLQDSFYEPVADKLQRAPEPLVQNAIQGYFIDVKTSDKYGITTLDQLKDPKIAGLFDANGNGKADLCCTEPGWGAEKIIDFHIPKYGLADTVENLKGSYQALITDTISRFKQGKPILFYTWTPNWVLAVFEDQAVQLQVPFSACPDRPEAECKTTLPSGENVGWEVNQIYVAMNRDSAKKNPVAWKFLECLRIDIADVNAYTLQQSKGDEDAQGAARAWIAKHPEFDSCVKDAQSTA